jgi:hypothetical protein
VGKRTNQDGDARLLFDDDANSGQLVQITIPACVDHGGIYSRVISVPWKCLECGGPRGKPVKGFSYDGSRTLLVDTWTNPCGHVETFARVRLEYGFIEPLGRVADGFQ